MTPFDLLRAAHDGCPLSFARFAEFMAETHGRRALEWSRGRSNLRQIYNIDDVADEVVAARGVDEAYRLLGFLSRDDWRWICRHGYRGVVLALALNGGMAAVLHFLDSRA
jgi:hypothetical protein